ncbi:MAG: PaaI family thioesterase [Acidimicrobiales bacterium]
MTSDEHSEVNETVEFFRACIGSADVWAGGPPFTRWLGGVLVERDEMANPAGLLHGGMQCAMLGDAVGLAAFTLGRDGFHLSINLATDYLASAAVGATVRATAEIARAGLRVVHASATLSDPDGRTLASASSNLLWSPQTTTTV